VLARAHSLLGIVPLSAFLCVHIVANWPALRGREAWVDAMAQGPSRGWLVLLVLVPLALHAVLGLLRMRQAPEGSDALRGPASLRTLQAISGVIVLGFVLYHVSSLWALSAGPHASAGDVYALLWTRAGRPIEIAVYVIGMAAVCLHVAHGWSRAAVTWGWARSARAVLWWRAGSGAVGFALFFLLLQIFARFAIGQPLIAAFG
jgi:succinate dehydrogenase / fumarate reductase cytochrome b subunit